MMNGSFERALEKQQREAKRIADATERRERANAIVSGQSFVNGMRIMDQNSEIALQKLLDAYDGNESNNVRGNFEIFPEYIRKSLNLEFEKLQMYGMITSHRVWGNSMWDLYLTTKAKEYFANKEIVMNTEYQKSINSTDKRMKYDVFLSHANKDKLTYVNGLYKILRKLGIDIFYDSDIISWGDDWKQVILEGTAQSEFAIIVISNQYFGREWTEKELDEFLHRQNESGQKIILPLLYGITIDEFKNQYPKLESIQSIITSDYTKDGIAILLAKELIKRYK